MACGPGRGSLACAAAMDSTHAQPQVCSANEIVARIAPHGDGVLTFDGDGTLWTGDVGEDVFTAALERGMLLDVARPALAAVAARHGTDPAGDANRIAAALYDGYRDGRVGELAICDVMSWCYAGHRLDELHRFASEVLRERDLPGRRIDEVGAIIDWARAAGRPLFVVSASPQFVVEQASQIWGWSAAHVVASPAAVDSSGCLLPLLAAPTPYGPAKVSRARARFGESARWLAAFGDNGFDLEMLLAARVGVAVRPKPGLAGRLDGSNGIVHLASAAAVPRGTRD
ncbi:MAG: haloacid dehalogenase-like hydrolase [Myxococcales bacterium FL481]|nr:MAG: haloacid dehalogenase-like hydrolase [Myxococcales bacterium FL481]